MNLNFVLVAFILAAPPASAGEEPVGQNTLRMESENPVRETRRELAVVNSEIKDLEQRIRISQSQALTAQAAVGSATTPVASFAALTSALEMERTELVGRRSRLQAQLHPVDNE